MKTLILMRHAKSAWDDPHQKDIDRPLAPRGKKAAPKVADWLAQAGYRPDLVLSSPAKRTRETWELVKFGLPKGTKAEFPRELYMAAPRDLLAAVASAPAEARTLMLIGHNPGLGHLAEMLTGSGDAKAVANIHTKFPTGAVAVLTFETDAWKEVAAGKGALAAFVRPRDL